MTREDAIEHLKEWKEIISSGYRKAAIDMAIEALKEKNQSDSLVRDDAENCKESESKLDLISRQDVIKTVIRMCSPICDWELEKKAYTDCVVAEINSLPSAEAVEVVRCKDCIRTKERDEYTGRLWCSIHRGYMEDTYYCADGLRREDGEA